jgi:transposase-like protein
VLKGVCGEENIAELCRREGITLSMYCGWSKQSFDAGKRCLAGDTARAATSNEVKELRHEAQAMKEAVAHLPWKTACSKKHARGWEVRHIRYPAAEKAEIIRLVEASHLPARRKSGKLDIPKATFYRWYDRYLSGGIEALANRRSRPDRVWNRIPEPRSSSWRRAKRS